MPRKNSFNASRVMRTADNTIGERIKQMRKARGLTQSQLANASGLLTKTVADYESGVRVPGIRSAVLLCRGLMCDLPDMCFLPLDLSGEDFAALPVGGTGSGKRR